MSVCFCCYGAWHPEDEKCLECQKLDAMVDDLLRRHREHHEDRKEANRKLLWEGELQSPPGHGFIVQEVKRRRRPLWRRFS